MYRLLVVLFLLGSFGAGFAGIAGCSKRRDPPRPAAKESISLATTTTSFESKDGGSETPAPESSAAVHGPRLLTGKKVLHVGDSMVGGSWGLTRAFEAKLSTVNAKIVRHTKVSESLTSFDKSSVLRDLLRTHDPDIVVITLGANDALVPHPEVFARSIQNIVKRVGSRECWWLGPPMWQKDSGIVAVIRDNALNCHFFDSSKLNLERANDGIHPSDRGGAKWADAFWEEFVALPESP